MPLSLPTRDTLLQQILAIWRNRWPGKDDHTESWIGKEVRAMTLALLGFHRSVESVDNDVLPSKKSSRAGLERAAFTFGIPASTPGSYGSKSSSASSGGAGECTGTNGTVFGDGLILLAPDGVTQIKLVGAVTIPGIPPGSGTVTGAFAAVTPGTVGNLAVGTQLTWQSTPSGANSTVTLTTALTGALDTESDPALLDRNLGRLQKPPKGGTVSDYRTWAESVSGVFRAYVYPLRSGLGSVDVVVTASGTGTGRNPGSGVQEAVDDYIAGDADQDGQRPTTVAGYSTLLPDAAVSGMNIRLRMTPSVAKYSFDWAPGATSYTVSAHAAGPPATVTLSPAPPADLVAAALTSTKPRIQILVSTGGGPVIPIQVRVQSIAGSVLTLENPLPSGWVAPTNGDRVFAGGPMVIAIAQAVLGYVDSLGPSRASGAADPNDTWEDTCAIFRLAEVALDVLDTDGTKFAKNCISGGVTIDGAATDKQATDASANGPELLYAKWIAITD